MKIALITAISGESCKKLADALREQGHVVSISKPFDTGRENFSDVDVVFSYGCSKPTYHKKRINNSLAIATCVNKVMTFERFKKAGVPTVEYTTDFHNIPEEWDQVACRKTLNGCKATGLEYFYRDDKNLPKNYPLYTKVFYGKYEYRIVIYQHKLVGVYYKREDDEGNWWFNLQKPTGFEQMIQDAIKASKALNIEYVGFDVLAKNKRSYVFLEANSGPSLTPEACDAIVASFS